MGGLSLWHWIVVGTVAFILFGGKFKISEVMGDVAKGIKAFKKGLAEDESKPAEEPQKSLEHQPLAHDAAAHDKPAEARKL
ncbi:twin-arginine translocase TatA/TatE family subunit [Methylosinus sp. Sm6]|uniref:twin-arginine translocase TatA/TatE family subunit n=1 Tax=Methylosinus sp. Sm6 TaxID=2866948 RepID=UPI001C9A057C|nr:twin-arginine translocase TatA/TatE family subunit [Methylosinus sp. Sm6]MBY6241160.1 twin-arginine translocase TatA/TatE family subunit [Methylosinus sp. Sm6]